ncbi:MAG TPA: hypothetical protein VMT85_02835 [Thermoanaerobaculia bacterium]|nr:hypothetical protein [Thermoanaerobaculia bacterium]
MRGLRSVVVPAALVAALLGGTVWAGGGARSRIFERELSAGELSAVRVAAGNGKVTVVAHSEELVRVRLEARPKRFTGDEDRGPLGWFLTSRLDDEQELLRTISLDEEVEHGALALRLLPRGRSRESRIEETWLLEVPSRFAVELSASSAEVGVTGVAGGVRLRQGHGSATVDVPGGALDLALDVGRLEARSGAPDWQRVALRSQVGDTRLVLDGRRVREPKPPGPGSQVTLEGRGTEILELRVQVGDAVLRLEEESHRASGR